MFDYQYLFFTLLYDLTSVLRSLAWMISQNITSSDQHQDIFPHQFLFLFELWLLFMPLYVSFCCVWGVGGDCVCFIIVFLVINLYSLWCCCCIKNCFINKVWIEQKANGDAFSCCWVNVREEEAHIRIGLSFPSSTENCDILKITSKNTY